MAACGHIQFWAQIYHHGDKEKRSSAVSVPSCREFPFFFHLVSVFWLLLISWDVSRRSWSFRIHPTLPGMQLPGTESVSVLRLPPG